MSRKVSDREQERGRRGSFRMVQQNVLVGAVLEAPIRTSNRPLTNIIF